MKNWTIGRRLIANSATLLALLIVVGAIGISALRQTETLVSARLRDDAIPGINAMSDIIENMLGAQVCALAAGNETEVAERDRLLAELATIVTSANEAYKAYEASITAPEDRANFDELVKRRMTNRTARNAYIELVKAGKRTEADAFSNGELGKLSADYRAQAHKMLKWNQDAANRATSDIIATTDRAVRLSLIVSGLSLVVGIVFAAFLIRGLNRLLHQLSVTLDDSAGQVSAAAGQVSASSQSLAEGSSEQAASLEETSSSLEELSSMTKRNAGSAGNAKQLSGETRSAAEAGNTDMAEMREAMDAIKTSSSDIGKIIKTIDEIAFQTNILALNAAVEAARAGEAGMGFAVVAEEVRALAQRSANSAKETATKIEVAIRNGEHGAQISDKVAHSLALIVGKAREVDQLIGEIAVASNEQTQGIGQINSAVSQMDKVTQSNAGNAEETAAAAEELNAQSMALKEAVGELRRLVSGAAPARPAAAKPTPPPAAHRRPQSAAPQTIQSSRRPQPSLAAASANDGFFRDS